MPINTDQQYNPISNPGWSKIYVNQIDFLIKIVKPALQEAKTLSTPALIAQSPQLQIYQFYQDLMYLRQFQSRIEDLFDHAQSNFDQLTTTHQPLKLKLYQPRYFLKYFHQAIEKLQTNLSNGILNDINYHDQLLKIGRYLPKYIAQCENKQLDQTQTLDLNQLKPDLNRYFWLDYGILNQSIYQIKPEIHRIDRTINNWYTSNSKTMVYFYVRTLRSIKNIQIKIVNFYLKSQLIPYPKEFIQQLFISDLITKNQAEQLQKKSET